MYERVFDELRREIESGRFADGQKFPSEAALVKRFDTSRITIGRALRELQQRGLVDRVAGSGTYVRRISRDSAGNLLFGLIIPNLGETEIFEPICQGIANSPEAATHGLLWPHADPNSSSKEDQAWQLCRQCVERRVSGVFFAPLEFSAAAAEVNRRVLTALDQAGIPVVLLDRRPENGSERRRLDLVGIDNHRAGYLATEHLLRLGAMRVGFIAYQNQASTVSGRIAGYRDALAAYGHEPAREFVLAGTPDGELDLDAAAGSCDAFVCANDRIAAYVMRRLLARNVHIPQDVRIVGIDDVAYAALLPVPLTTIHQPCREIGEAALHAMLERLVRPRIAARDVLLDCWPVIRESCGAQPKHLAAPTPRYTPVISE
jgi:DNA-binding LacI/PurR family transcriptional regulator